MRIAWFSELGDNIREEMKGLRWLLMTAEDLPKATAAWMFAELDGVFIGIDHKGTPFKSGIHNRAIHLLLVDENNGITGITKVITEGNLIDNLW